MVAGILFGSNTVIGNTCMSTPGEDFDLLGLLLLLMESASEWNCAPCPSVGEPDLRPFSETLQMNFDIILWIL